MSLGLSFIWAMNHTAPLPVILSGTIWYWLVMKTRVIWPSIICHALANFFLYLFVQVVLYLKIVEITTFGSVFTIKLNLPF